MEKGYILMVKKLISFKPNTAIFSAIPSWGPRKISCAVPAHLYITAQGSEQVEILNCSLVSQMIITFRIKAKI